jgi:hypothetical protein
LKHKLTIPWLEVRSRNIMHRLYRSGRLPGNGGANGGGGGIDDDEESEQDATDDDDGGPDLVEIEGALHRVMSACKVGESHHAHVMCALQTLQ